MSLPNKLDPNLQAELIISQAKNTARAILIEGCILLLIQLAFGTNLVVSLSLYKQISDIVFYLAILFYVLVWIASTLVIFKYIVIKLNNLNLGSVKLNNIKNWYKILIASFAIIPIPFISPLLSIIWSCRCLFSYYKKTLITTNEDDTNND